ncbi:MAG: translocation/assembly module TamB domain-containing protein [Steroidobacteraceae bacterium]
MRWRRLVVPVMLLLALLAGGVLTHRLLFSEQGLQALLERLQELDGLRIEVEGARGVLAGPLSAERLVIDHEAVRIEARGVRVDPTLGGLFSGLVTLETLEVDGLDVLLKKTADKPPTEPRFLPRFLRIAAPGLAVRDVAVTLANGQVLRVASLRGDLRMTRWRVDMDTVALEDPAGSLAGELALRATTPLGLRVAASGHWRLPDERDYRFEAQARGNLDRLAAELAITEPARLSFSGTALTLTGAAHLVGTVRAADFDGSPWIPAGRLPRLTGSVALDAGLAAIGIDGTFTSPAFGDEPLRIQGAARRSGRQFDIDSLRAWLPRSEMAVSLAGAVRVEGEAPVLDLQGEWTALRWPIAAEPVVESSLGVFELTGPLPYAFEVKALARGPQLPESDFTARGSFDRTQLLLDRIDAFVLRGRLAGSGRLSWTDGQAWRAAFDGTALDVAALRPDLSGRINVTGTIAGRGFAADAPWTARVDSLSGTLLGRTLTGKGEVSHRDGTYALEQVRVANGPSHVDIDGLWGPTVDLQWNADIRSLAVVSPGMAGEFVSSGVARGPQDRLHVVADARVRDLRYGAWTVESSDATVDVDFSDRQDSRIDLRATEIGTGGLPVETVRVRANGRVAEHDITIEISVPPHEQRRFPGFEAALSAGGGANLRGRSWSGSLASATMLFPDGSAQLIQPVAIDLGPALVKSAPLCLETGEARLCAEGEWHDAPRSWRVIYSAQDWPLKRLLTSLLGRREFDGKLQASGWAQQEPGKDWIGGTTLLLDSPTVDIPRNKFRTQRFDLGRGQLDLFAQVDAIRVTTELQMAESTRVSGHATIVRKRGQAMADHPMSGQLVAESAVLSALPLIVPEIDRSEGRLDAAVNIGGRVGAPQFDGEFHLKDGRFDLYRTNLVLLDVTLDGKFVGDELDFGGRAGTNKGPVTLQGRFRWPEGVMTGNMQLKGEDLLVADTPEYRVLASPDVTVQADASGFDVTGEVLIPMARIAPKDLSTSVSTSPDERVVGIDTEDTGPSTLERVRSRVRMALGDNVRVDSQGLKALLGGEVTVTTRPGDVARGNGAIRVVEGEYKAFGQFVKITRGVLRYDDTPLTEPTVDLVAEREIKNEDITVSVNVRGRLDAPFITLTSDPAMSNNEALSYLITGRSLNTLQSGEAASVDRAAEDLALSGGGLLLGSIGTRLGLDEVSVERTGEDDTSVVLGKALSPRLFVSYGISIAEAINTIKLRYTLNKRWSIKAEGGLEQSADFEYRIER